MRSIFTALAFGLVFVSPVAAAAPEFSVNLSSGAVSAEDGALVVASPEEGVTVVSRGEAELARIVRSVYGIDIDARSTRALSLTGVTDAGYVTISGTEQTLSLTLDSVTIASPNGPALNILSKAATEITLLGTNSLRDAAVYTPRLGKDGTELSAKAALFAEGDLEFRGEGSLRVEALAKHAIASDRSIRVAGGTFSVHAAKKDAFRANDSFVMDAGSLKIRTEEGKGIKVEGKERKRGAKGFIVINAGTIEIDSYDKGITASWDVTEDAKTADTSDDPNPAVTINGGDITIKTRAPYVRKRSPTKPEGIEAKSDLVINGGRIWVQAPDDGLNAGNSVTINGGYVYTISGGGDGIDSNGTVSVTGGVVVTIGGEGWEGGFDCDRNDFSVTGGLFAAVGGHNSHPTESLSAQPTVILRRAGAGLVVIRDEAGRAVFAYDMPARGGELLVTAPGLREGGRYSLYEGGRADGVEGFAGLVVGANAHEGGSLVKEFSARGMVTNLDPEGGERGPPRRRPGPPPPPRGHELR